MTDHRWRVPHSAQTLALALDQGESANLFPIAATSTEHPTFTARAAIWRDHRAGLISLAEAQRRSAALGAPVQRSGPAVHAPGSSRPKAAPRPRQSRSAPNQSRQYAGEMATTAARDDRLTPNAKALLQVIRARCGNSRSTRTTKATLAAVMARSMRTIRRYLGDLEALGYIVTETARNGRGLHLGLALTITEKVLPFFERPAGLAQWLAETRPLADLPFSAETPGNHRVTFLTPKNQTGKSISLRGRNSAWRIARARPRPTG